MCWMSTPLRCYDTQKYLLQINRLFMLRLLMCCCCCSWAGLQKSTCRPSLSVFISCYFVGNSSSYKNRQRAKSIFSQFIDIYRPVCVCVYAYESLSTYSPSLSPCLLATDLSFSIWYIQFIHMRIILFGWLVPLLLLSCFACVCSRGKRHFSHDSIMKACYCMTDVGL